MGIDISRLGSAVRRQALQKLQGQAAAKGAKYHNEPDTRGALRFDSKKEARRYDELMLLLRAGEIRDLRLQQNFTLQEGYTTPEGERVRPIVYRADFVYEREGVRVVEDAKGCRTQEYGMKRKMMLEKFGISVCEV